MHRFMAWVSCWEPQSKQAQAGPLRPPQPTLLNQGHCVCVCVCVCVLSTLWEVAPAVVDHEEGSI